MTAEEIAKSISAAYDSVNLINELDTKSHPLSTEDEYTKVRNVEHLRIMMGKDWFFEGLTTEQINTISVLIE
jgi:hypothetical protein